MSSLEKTKFSLIALVVSGVVGITDCRSEATTQTPARFSKFNEVSLSEIKPQGWLRQFLTRQKNGLGGRPEVSGYPFNTAMWKEDITIPEGHYGDSWWPYEQTAYYLDGIIRCGYLLNDAELIQKANTNLDWVLNHQDKDNLLGPQNSGDWSRTIFFRALMAKYSATKDRSILDALTKHYLTVPRVLSEGRDLLNIEIILWLYGETENEDLLKLAEESFEQISGIDDGGEYDQEGNKDDTNTQNKESRLYRQLISSKKPHGHGVTWCENMKIPAILYTYTGKKKYLDATINGINKIQKHHLLVDGCPSAVEHLRGKAVDMAHETCDTVDFSWSLGYVLMATGEARWADMIERDIFNAGLGSLEKNFRGHQYYSAPNQPVAAENTSHYNDSEFWGEMAHARFCYRPSHDTECCTGNIERMLPQFAGRMWMKSKDNGVVATLYGPAQIITKVGANNDEVTIVEKTTYPFSEKIDFVIQSKKPVHFPLELRIPEWCNDAIVRINGNKVDAELSAGTFFKLKRTFNDGDVITLHLPMELKLTRWGENGRGIAIERGPLVYSFPISSRTVKYTSLGCKDIDQFPDLLMYPESTWNYAVDLNEKNLKQKAKVVFNKNSGYCWDLETVPVAIKVSAKKVLNWKMEGTALPKEWPVNLELSNDEETITLVPLGATMLRITIFPEAK
jgi:DUF1680 family protein